MVLGPGSWGHKMAGLRSKTPMTAHGRQHTGAGKRRRPFLAGSSLVKEEALSPSDLLFHLISQS